VTLLFEQIESIDLKQLHHTLQSIKTTKDNKWDDFLRENGLIDLKGKFQWQENHPIEKLPFEQPLIKTFINQLLKEEITNINEEIISSILSLNWIIEYQINKILVFPHQLSISTIFNKVDMKGLKININQVEKVKSVSLSTYMVCFLKALIKHDILLYINKESDVTFTMKRKVAIKCDEEEKGSSHILYVDLEEKIDHQFSHQEEHIDDEMTILQANIDDMNPEIFPFVMDKLFENGANDVYLSPIVMKKGRNGTLLNVLCSVKKISSMESIIFSETSTIGIRSLPVGVHRLGRTIDAVKTKWGSVPIKISKYFDQIVQVSPEFEDCKKLAIQHKVPLKLVYQETVSQIESRFGESFSSNAFKGGSE
jgi:hypothetical protein